MRTRMSAGAAAAIAACAVLGGCVLDDSARALDARYRAGWRPSASYCAWGGETGLLAAYCARLNFGDAGALAILLDLNEAAPRDWRLAMNSGTRPSDARRVSALIRLSLAR